MPSVSAYGRVQKRIFNPGRPNAPTNLISLDWRLNAPLPPTHPPTLRKKNKKKEIVRFKLSSQVSILLEILCSCDQGMTGRLIVVGTKVRDTRWG